jgi:hypothetical protein
MNEILEWQSEGAVQKSKCSKCGKPKAADDYRMCAECDWWYTIDILN